MVQSEKTPRWVWLAAVAILAVGVTIGATLYALLGAGAAAPSPQPSDLHAEDEHSSLGEGVIEIPLEAQKEGGVQVEPATPKPFRNFLKVTGVIGPDQTRVTNVRPLARGVIDEVFVQLGDQVRRGQPLLSYDNIELGLAIGEYLSASSQLRASRTDLDVKKKILDRSAEMLRVGAQARTTHDIREAEYRSAQSSVDNAQSNVAKFEEQLHRFGLSDADLETLVKQGDSGYHRTASHTAIKAPIGGVVTAYNLSRGETVDPSSELLTITDISTVWVLADVYERDLGSVKHGSSVSIRVASYPDEVFTGRITYISDVIETQTRTARVRCVVDNSEKRLKLDMFATIEIPTNVLAEGIAVPKTAIQQIDNRTVVFIQRSETTFEQRPVTAGLDANGWVQILSGVREGDRVISVGSFYAKTAALREQIGDEH
jgi:cobalt-zinc-cadmium efflux system membrane fusion protein